MDLSIIIINYNTSQLTLNCVTSILKWTPKSIEYEVIIIDNCSSFDDYIHLKENIDNLILDKIILFRSKVNSGFSGGNMLGVQFAKGNFLAFINNDVVLVQDSFSSLFTYFENNSDTGVIGLQPIFENNKKQVAFGHFDTFANRFLGYWLYEKLNPRKTKRYGIYEIPIVADYIVGSFMLFKSKDFYKIGGFDTNIFLYFEEMDICKRLKNINLKTIFIPHINYIHINGASTSLGYAKKIELKISHLYVIRKNHGFLSYLFLKFFFIIVFLLKSIFNPKHFKMLVKLLTFGLSLSSSIRHKQIILEE